jgi:Uma2 family endonuclease
MNWQEVCAHPSLQNLPFKIELNEWGQVVMSPTKLYHSIFQGRITRQLPESGEIIVECAIETAKGVKVADVAWASDERFELIKNEDACSVAPEICVEVLSTSNTKEEINEKRALYFAVGAQEVWTCNKNGTVKFYDAQGELKQSRLVPDFPRNIKF